MPTMRVMIVDDEAPARRKIRRYLEREPDIEIVGEAGGGVRALEEIARVTPDLLFLDVQMPGLDGFEIVEALDLPAMPQIVFVTAHDQYALRAFEVHALDYLLKPFDRERFQKVLGRSRKHFQHGATSNLDGGIHKLLEELRGGERRPARLLIQANGRAFFLPIDRISWVESAKNYVNIHSGTEAYLLRGTIDGLHKRLDPAVFIRANRAQIVNIESIKELHPWFHGEYQIILHDGTEIRWSRRYLDRSSALFIKHF